MYREECIYFESNSDIDVPSCKHSGISKFMYTCHGCEKYKFAGGIKEDETKLQDYIDDPVKLFDEFVPLKQKIEFLKGIREELEKETEDDPVVHTYWDAVKLMCGNCGKRFGAPCFDYEVKYICWEYKRRNVSAMCPNCESIGVVSDVVRGDLKNCVSCKYKIYTDGKELYEEGHIQDCDLLCWSLGGAFHTNDEVDLLTWFILSRGNDFADNCPRWSLKDDS